MNRKEGKNKQSDPLPGIVLACDWGELEGSQHFQQGSQSLDRGDKKENSKLQLTCEVKMYTKISIIQVFSWKYFQIFPLSLNSFSSCSAARIIQTGLSISRPTLLQSILLFPKHRVLAQNFWSVLSKKKIVASLCKIWRFGSQFPVVRNRAKQRTYPTSYFKQPPPPFHIHPPTHQPTHTHHWPISNRSVFKVESEDWR